MPGATASRGSAAAPAVASSGFHRGITLRSGASSLSSFSMRLAVVAIMAERLTILVTCLVVFGNNAIVVPGLYQSGSKLIDEWNLFPRHPGCYPIHRKYGAMCSVFSYNTTRSSGAVGFNFLHHQRQKEAFDQLKTYQPLINAGCSRDLRFLLCSFHFPVCSEHLMEPITPCRSLCERVQNDCGAVLAREGVQWPETINCSYLLEESRLGGGERMHVCVSHTTELDQATRATPIEREVVRPPVVVPSPCESDPCRNGAACQQVASGFECMCRPGWKGTHCEEADCPMCKSVKLKKKKILKAQYNWVMSGVVLGEARVKGKRICQKVNVTEVFHAKCNNTVTLLADSTQSVCVLRPAPTCPECFDEEHGFLPGTEMVFAGKLIRSSRFVIDLEDRPLFIKQKASHAKKLRDMYNMANDCE